MAMDSRHLNERAAMVWRKRFVFIFIIILLASSARRIFLWHQQVMVIHDLLLDGDPTNYDRDLPIFHKQTRITQSRQSRRNTKTSFTTRDAAVDLRPNNNIKVLLTDFGWNSPDPIIAKDRFRSLRSKALLEAIQRHPNFDAVLWRNIMSHQVKPDPRIHYYVFLDLESCPEKNWPNYGRRLDGNTDLEGGRSRIFRWTGTCQAMAEVATSPLFTSNCCWAKLVLFDCAGYGPEMCLGRQRKQIRLSSMQGASWYALASISAANKQLDLSLDQGLPPPPPLTTIPFQEQFYQNLSHPTLTTDELNSGIIDCYKKRPNLLFFAGNFRSGVRKVLQTMHDPSKFVITNPDYRIMRRGGFSFFLEQLQQSEFGAVPRGDNLFSYRFTESLAAGAIPVVYADDWVLPFRPELVDWATCCAVIIAESDVNRTYDILSNISQEERCRMRKNGNHIFHKYMKTTDGVISGILQGLELVARYNVTPADG